MDVSNFKKYILRKPGKRKFCSEVLKFAVGDNKTMIIEETNEDSETIKSNSYFVSTKKAREIYKNAIANGYVRI